MLLLRLRADLGARPARSHCLPRVLRDAKAGRAVELVGVGASLTGDFAGAIGRDQDRHATIKYGGLPARCRGSRKLRAKGLADGAGATLGRRRATR